MCQPVEQRVKSEAGSRPDTLVADVAAGIRLPLGSAELLAEGDVPDFGKVLRTKCVSLELHTDVAGLGTSTAIEKNGDICSARVLH